MRSSVRPRRGTGLIAGLVAAFALAGLAGCAPAGAGEPGLPAGLAVELRQQRDDVALRQAQLVFRNDGEATLEVAELSIEDPRFDGPILRHTLRTSRIPPDSVVQIRVELPPVDCAAGNHAVARLALPLTVDGESRRVETDVADPLGFVSALHARECRAEELGRIATVAVTGFQPSAPPEPALLLLSVHGVAGAAPAVIVGIQETPLLAFPDPPDASDYRAGWPLALEIGTGSVADTELAVPVLPGRCDAHVIQEDKRGTLFTIDIMLGGEPGEIELAAPAGVKGRILQWVADWCGLSAR